MLELPLTADTGVHAETRIAVPHDRSRNPMADTVTPGEMAGAVSNGTPRKFGNNGCRHKG